MTSKNAATTSVCTDECLHPGRQTYPPNTCPDCGRFSAHSWHDGGYSTPSGWYETWGGTCVTHGDWSDSA